MHSQLQLVADEYTSAQARLHDLVRAVPGERWGRRADPARWSVAEGVGHLNLTSMAYLPRWQHHVSRPPILERRPPGRYHRDPIGGRLWEEERVWVESECAERDVREGSRGCASGRVRACGASLSSSAERPLQPRLVGAGTSVRLPLGMEGLQRPFTSLSTCADGEDR